MERNKDIFLQNVFNIKSKNFKGESKHIPNGKTPNLCSENDIVMIIQTCALVSNRGSPSSKKWMLDSARKSHVCNWR